MAVSRPSGANAPESGQISVPALNLDPVQSLQPWPVTITFCNEDVTIPAMPAAGWLTVLMSKDLSLDDVFPGLLGEDEADWVDEQILDGHLGVGELQDLVLEIIELASARRWWVTLRLVDVAKRSWDVIGAELILRGIDATQVSFSAWLDVLLVTVLKNMDTKDTTMFNLRLEAPPEDEEEPEEMEMDRSSFLALGS